MVALTELCAQIRRDGAVHPSWFIPVGFELVDDYRQHLGHRVAYAFHLTVAVWMVGAGGNFPNPEKPIDSVREEL